ncbi:Uncharacterized protein dnm_080350 [Desulfonema magnum]|uniref:Uncharacterized protein n=1 Tax=Desulfonema magnum TaxID=45655 RepID=A0A975GSJ1_9BACT|nr:Uncharacterized protein dnm_080350 [Desulfonema magnum]
MKLICIEKLSFQNTCSLLLREMKGIETDAPEQICGLVFGSLLLREMKGIETLHDIRKLAMCSFPAPSGDERD